MRGKKAKQLRRAARTVLPPDAPEKQLRHHETGRYELGVGAKQIPHTVQRHSDGSVKAVYNRLKFLYTGGYHKR